VIRASFREVLDGLAEFTGLALLSTLDLVESWQPG
jgi:hypothetical protein